LEIWVIVYCSILIRFTTIFVPKEDCPISLYPNRLNKR
jgi:hypothetical protein